MAAPSTPTLGLGLRSRRGARAGLRRPAGIPHLPRSLRSLVQAG